MRKAMQETMQEARHETTPERMQAALRHHRSGRLREAARIYQKVLSVEPNHADSLHLLGMVAYQSGDLERAVELIRRAIAQHKTAASYYSNLGNVLQRQQNMEEAEACYRQSLALQPGRAEVYLNLGHTLKAKGQVDAAMRCYQSARARHPQLAEAQVAEATAHLLKGEFDRGWPDFEARWRTSEYDTKPRSYPQPQWRGERLSSGRVLIWGEQGVGDEILFAGLLPDVLRTLDPAMVASGSACALDCDVRLKPLFARSFPSVQIVSHYDPARDQALNVAAHLPSGSLPGLFRRGSEDFRATPSPYLVADPETKLRFRKKYSDGRPLVGMAWHTSNQSSGQRRSIALELLAPLLTQTGIPPRGIRWISLQYGDHETLRSSASATGLPLLIDEEVHQLADIDTFAAQVAAMDLVLTIDNSTAHLAGALGVPTWTLLPFAPDWRWQLEREDSPWYPSMRLFRQPSPGDWRSVLAQVRSALESRFGAL